PDGKVFKLGGQAVVAPIKFVSGTETFDVAFSTISYQGSMSTARVFSAATLLQDGRVVVSGGQSSAATYLNSAEAVYYNYTPDSRRPSITNLAPALTKAGTTITLTGSSFVGQRDTATGGQGMAGADNLPRVTLQ